MTQPPSMPAAPDPRIKLLITASSVISAVLAVAFGLIYLRTQSKLAMASGADSLQDVLTALALLWAVNVSLRPADDSHPFGHQAAQPVTALIVAMLAGMLAVEVFVDSVRDLLGQSQGTLTTPIAITLATKVVFKVLMVVTAKRFGNGGSALDAFVVDARNDVLVGLVSLVGYGCGRHFGAENVDAALAIPVAVWIAYSGFDLARESIHYIMGGAPPEERKKELLAIASAASQPAHIRAFKVRYQGNSLHIWVELHVDPNLTVGEGHDIGDRMQVRLLQEADVYDVVVHVDAISPNVQSPVP